MSDRKRPPSDLTPFGTWFLTELQLRGWSQADFARKSGTQSRRISEWIHRANPDLDSVVKIADTLNLSISTVAARVLNRPELRAEPIAAEIADLARAVPEQLLLPFAIALRALQDPRIQAAARKQLDDA